jgi:hypothetical protein
MKAMSRSFEMETLADFEPTIDPQVAEQVGQEILENRLDPATWATALSASGGKRQEALAAYARIRLHRVASHQRLRQAKVASFESRRVNQCFGVRTVQDLLWRAHPERQLNFLKPRLSVLPLVILCIGSAGSVGVLGRLLGHALPDLLAMLLPSVALLAGLAVVAAAVMLRFTLPKRWIMLGWNTGLLCACAVACFGSLLGGVKLIARAAPLEVVEKAGNPVAVSAVTAPQAQDQSLAVITP